MMGNKAVTLMVFGILVSIFIIYFAVQNMIFNGPENSIISLFNRIEKYAAQGNWDEAKKAADELENKWSASKQWLTLNYAEADYSIFTQNMTELKGAVEAEDIKDVQKIIETIREYWQNFTKFVPEPSGGKVGH